MLIPECKNIMFSSCKREGRGVGCVGVCHEVKAVVCQASSVAYRMTVVKTPGFVHGKLGVISILLKECKDGT